MTAKIGYVTTACRLSEDIVPPDANLTISSQGFDLKLLIHSPRENMYLCFNKRWKLVGRRISREEAQRERRCLFYESLLAGYNTYSSVANTSRYVGFNARGQQLRRPLQLVPHRRVKCITFMKEDDSFDIGRHNSRLGGDDAERPPRRRHRPPAGNALRPPCPADRLRHHQSRHLRRKVCDGT